MYSEEEKRALIGIGLPTIFLRFGKALVYLVFLYYGLTLTDNEFLIGLAFGITALVQAALTIPFGFLSDKYGRKKMIVFGLVMFIIGSFLAAHPFDNIFILIFARFLQGISAIYSCVLAFIGDTIPDTKRSRTMAIFSIFSGIVFSFGIIIGPTIAPVLIPYSFLFLISGILAIISLIYLIVYVPESKPEVGMKTKESNLHIFKDAFINKNLLLAYGATFISNFVLVSILFLLVPIMLAKFMPVEYTGLVLIPIFLFGMGIMLFGSKAADKGKRKQLTLIGFGLVSLGLVMFFLSHLAFIILGLVAFFTGMAILDPILPSIILKATSNKAMGTASGVYNLTRYLGEGTGAVVAGLLILIFTNNIQYILAIFIILILIGIILIGNLSVVENKATI
jgi:MFS family permease